MSNILFIFLIGIAFVLDGAFQALGAGVVWVTPLVYMITVVTSRGKGRSWWVLAIFALAIDLFSGFPFGIVTLVLLGIAGAVVMLRRWIDWHADSLPVVGASALLLTVVFLSVLYVIR